MNLKCKDFIEYISIPSLKSVRTSLLLFPDLTCPSLIILPWSHGIEILLLLCLFLLEKIRGLLVGVHALQLPVLGVTSQAMCQWISGYWRPLVDLKIVDINVGWCVCLRNHFRGFPDFGILNINGIFPSPCPSTPSVRLWKVVLREKVRVWCLEETGMHYFLLMLFCTQYTVSSSTPIICILCNATKILSTSA